MSKIKPQQLYVYKLNATKHIEKKKYSWAMVYLQDALRNFQDVVSQVQDEVEMEKLIKEVKIPCHKNLSLCYLKQANYQACIQQCDTVMELEPNNVKMLYRLGICYLSLNNLTEAERYLQKAYLLDPTEKEVMKALERIQENSNTQKVSPPPPPSPLVTLIKWLVLWPLYLFNYLCAFLFPKTKTQ